MQPSCVVSVMAVRSGQIDMTGKVAAQARKMAFEGVVGTRAGNDDENLALAVSGGVRIIEAAAAFLHASLTETEKPCQAAVGGAVRGVADRLGKAAVEDQPRADKIWLCEVGRPGMPAHDAGERVAVGESDSGKAERVGRLDELLGMRSPVQEGKVAGADQLRIGAHANSPCIHHCGAVAPP